MGLKSIITHVTYEYKFIRLKSDQNGIEIYCVILFLNPISTVKIRPKWDWNLKMSAGVYILTTC